MVLGNTSSTNVSVGLYPFGAVGYAYNVLRDNNGGNANPQIGAGGGANLGGNLCGSAICP